MGSLSYMATGEFFGGVMGFVWWVVIGFALRYRTPLVFPSNLFNSLDSVSVESYKRITEGKKERD